MAQQRTDRITERLEKAEAQGLVGSIQTTGFNQVESQAELIRQLEQKVNDQERELLDLYRRLTPRY